MFNDQVFIVQPHCINTILISSGKIQDSCNSNSVFRVQLEKIYENMGGTSLDSAANTVLTNLQKKLNTVLDKLAGQFAESLIPKIHEQMNTLGSILCKIKGPQLQKSQLVGVCFVKINLFIL